MYLELLILVAILTVAAYFLFKKDFLSPSFLLCVSFGVSILTAWVSKVFNLWNNVDLEALPFWMISLGLIATILGEYVVRKIWKFRKKSQTSDAEKDLEIIRLSKIKLAVVYGLILVILVVVVIEMMNITGIRDNIPQMINEYRNLTPIFSENGTSIGTFAMQLVRLTNVIGLIFVCLIINNYLKKDKLRNNIAYMGIVLLSLVVMLFVGGRSSMIQYAFATLALFVILGRRITKTKTDLKKQRVVTRKRIVVVGAILIVAFYAVMPLIGRSQKSGAMAYMSFYLGGPIPSLQKLIDEGNLSESKTFGQESLKDLQRNLGKFGFETDYVGGSGWVNFIDKDGMVLSSNVYTGMKPYYADWGMLGVFVCQFLFGFVYALIYLVADRSKSRFAYVVYAMLFVNIFDQIRAEQLFGLLSAQVILSVLYAYIAVKLLVPGRKMESRLVGGDKNGR